MQSEVRETAAAAVYRTAQSLLQRLPVSTTFVKWAIVGSIGYLVNQFALFAVYDSPLFAFLPARGTDFDFILFSHPDVRLLIASVVAVQVAMVSNFYWHERWTSRQRERRSPGPIRFLRFNHMSFGSPLIVLVTVNTLAPAFGLSPYIANTIAVGLGAAWSWIGDNQVIWRHILVTTLLVILGVAVFSSLDSHFLIRNSDFNFHFRVAERMIATGVIQSPNFLFPLLLIIVDASIPNIDTADAAFIVILASRVAHGVIIYALIQRAFGNSLVVLMVAAVVAFALTIISPITIFTWPDNLYSGYIGINVYHNPTIQVLQPLALLLFFYATRIFTRQPSDNSIVTILIAGMLTLLAALTKPSYTIVLLPGLVFLAYSRHLQKRQVDWRLMILGILLPALVVLGWQWEGFERSPAFLVSSEAVFGKLSTQIVISPFLVYSHFSSASLFLPKFVLSILFPLCVYALYFKKASNDISLSLAWPIFLVAAFYTYFLAESGSRMFHGNFGWSAEVALSILVVFSTVLLVQQEVRTKRFFICAAVFALHLISGVVWYDGQIGNPMGYAWG